MIPLTLGDIAELVGGEVVDGEASVLVTGAAFLDSRAPEPDGLFVAFAGEHADGHDHAPGAVASGAAAVLGTRPTGVPTVVVPDAQAALQELARQVLRTLREDGGPTVVAVTGSQGKTTAKDMLARVLGDRRAHGRDGRVVQQRARAAAHGAARRASAPATSSSRWARAGSGTSPSCAGSRRPMSRWCSTSGKAHIGEFGSQEQIAVAKGELVEALGPEGSAVLNADDPLVAAMAERTRGRVWTFGRAPEAQVRRVGRRGRRPRAPVVRPLLRRCHRAHRAATGRRAPGDQRSGDRRRGAGRRSAAGQGRGSVERDRPSLAVADGGPRAGRRAGRPQRRLQRQPRLDGLGARDARRDGTARGSPHRRGAGGDARARAPAPRRSTARSARSRTGSASTRSWSSAPGAPHPRRPLAERGDDGTTRQVDTVERAGEWLRDNVAGPDVVLVKASRAGRLERVADMLLGDVAGNSLREESSR